MGLKDPSSPLKLPIHDLSQAFREARESIPRTDEGLRVVPGILDPYK